jgi:hypothetical protein
MGHPDGAHTHGSGGSGLGEFVLVILAVALLGPAVAAAVAELLHLLVIVAAVLAVLAGADLVALGAWQLRHARQEMARVVYRVTPAPPRAVQAISEPRPRNAFPDVPRQAIEAPRQVHLHLHGVSAEDVAAIHQGDRGIVRPSIKEE